MIFKRKNKTEKKPGLFAKLRSGLSKTGDGISDVLLGKKPIDAALLEELEDNLLIADVGIETTQEIMQKLQQQISRKNVSNSEALYQNLRQTMQEQLAPCEQELVIDTTTKPFIILVVGVNGAGKTTTIGKLAQRFKTDGLSVMLAAGDTFRAAAIEQLQAWGERNDVPVVAQQSGSDSAAVIFDAVQAAQARGVDVLIADTAGRLHTQHNLMEELKKVVRVIKKADADAPHETLLVLDAGLGQNALQQAQKFHEATGVSGIALTKLDGTAKGGIIFAIAKQLSLPIRYIGVGEQAEDLQDFNAEQFVAALLYSETDND
jgi:fused signal recognition particle receptor